MKINTCVTASSFYNKYWMKIFNLLHEDLDLECLPPKDRPIPFLIQKYWMTIWDQKETNIGNGYLNQLNLRNFHLHRIWEFTQTIASIYFFSNNKLSGKKILSLGAGFEPCLFTFAKLGANVDASDIYYSPEFWHPELVEYIKKKPEIFCHYKNFKPKINYINVDLKSKKDISKLEKYDIIYSVSSLEHIYDSFRKKKKFFKNISKHLNTKGVLSFTTELIVKYDKTRRYKIIMKKIFDRLKAFPKLKMQNNYVYALKEENLSKTRLIYTKSRIKNIKRRKKADIIKLIKKIVNVIKNSYRYNRRYDFFTYEELKKIIKCLSKHDLFIIEKIDWKSCFEYFHKTLRFNDQYHTSISLTFCKNFKQNN